MIKPVEVISEKPGKQKCKGIVYRGRRSQYFLNGTVHERLTLKVLKRMSCAGCEKCGWVEEFLFEWVSMYDMDLSHIEDGNFYKIEVVSSQGYFETQPEIDEVKFVKIEG